MVLNVMSSISETELLDILNKLIKDWEYEVVEFKEASNDYDKNKIGQYFSAISNEANLKGLQFGWLVFGVRNKGKIIVGSDYRNSKGLAVLKQEITLGTTDGISFIEIYEAFPEINGEKKRVVLFQIPAAPTGIPVGWYNYFYGRNGESISALSIDELDRIRGQENRDWSKQILQGATIEHLDKEAIKLARCKYIEKMNRPHIMEEVENMSDEQFLTKLKLIQGGKVTNAAMVLLGNEDYDYMFASAPDAAWRVYNSKDEIKDYDIFKIPFITLSDRIFEKIRNLTYRYMPNQLTLFPVEVKQYDMWLLRELLNNCIAHMDYTIGGRVYLNEFEDKIMFANPGTFLPGGIEPVLNPTYNPPYKRNRLLADSMMNFNMIDTQTMGIRRVYKILKERYFPMPDYDFSESRCVKVTVYGKIIDEAYTRILFDNPEFDTNTVYLLDCVQKHKKISNEAVKHLRKLNVIEGKLPNIYVSANVAEQLDEKAQYTKNKGMDDAYYMDLIVKYLKKFESASKEDVRCLLLSKLPDSMNEKQKEDKIRNMLYSMHKKGVIDRDGSNRRLSKWILK